MNQCNHQIIITTRLFVSKLINYCDYNNVALFHGEKKKRKKH